MNNQNGTLLLCFKRSKYFSNCRVPKYGPVLPEYVLPQRLSLPSLLELGYERRGCVEI